MVRRCAPFDLECSRGVRWWIWIALAAFGREHPRRIGETRSTGLAAGQSPDSARRGRPRPLAWGILTRDGGAPRERTTLPLLRSPARPRTETGQRWRTAIPLGDDAVRRRLGWALSRRTASMPSSLTGRRAFREE